MGELLACSVSLVLLLEHRAQTFAFFQLRQVTEKSGRIDPVGERNVRVWPVQHFLASKLSES